VRRFAKVIQVQLPEGDPRRDTTIEIVKADAFAAECDWSDSDLVFANSTCFNKELFRGYCHIRPTRARAQTHTRHAFLRFAAQKLNTDN